MLAALSLSSGFLLSNIFNRYIGHNSADDEVRLTLEKVSTNEKLLKNSIIDLDMKWSVEENHNELIFQNIQDNFCELTYDLNLIKDEFIAYLILQ